MFVKCCVQLVSLVNKLSPHSEKSIMVHTDCLWQSQHRYVGVHAQAVSIGIMHDRGSQIKYKICAHVPVFALSDSALPIDSMANIGES